MSISEQRVCQNCEQGFTIEPDDFDFYEKMKVPAPIWCPDCRAQRRMSWRNERSLYKRKCDVPGHNEEIISIYSQDKPFKVYDQKYWWGDAWDAAKYAMKYDFSKPFFEQFYKFQKRVPRLAIYNINSVNSEYTNQAIDNRDCYLGISIKECENTFYITNGHNSKDCSDDFYVSDSELLYECIDVNKSYSSSFSQNCEAVVDSAFVFDCRNIQKCIGGVGLRNKDLLFFGKKITNSDFKKEQENLGSFLRKRELSKLFQKELLKYPHRAFNIIRGINSSGDFLKNCKRAYKCFNSFDIEESRYSVRIFRSKDMVDCYAVGDSEFNYEGIGIEEVYHNKFCYNTLRSKYMEYCDFCRDCSYCFGCIALNNKSYCILNRQYTKQEYEKLVPKIIQHMHEMPYKDKKGRVYKYGEYFPSEFSPFAYNETIAQEYFPLTKEQAIKQGYTWKDSGKRDYEITIKPQDLPDHIKEVDDSIINEIIECANHSAGVIARSEATKQSPAPELSNCTTAFKIIPSEFQFYKKMNLPLPRLCPNCRHYQRLEQRNPLKLWHRRCQCAGEKSDNEIYQNTIKHFHNANHCPNEFETTYAPERKEIVYCEACYLKEVV